MNFKTPLIISFLLFAISAHSQQNQFKDDIEIFKEQANLVIDNFQNYLDIIGSKERSKKVKTYYIDKALDIFLNQGKDVSVESLSTHTDKKVKYSVKSYLQRLANLPYAKVEVTQAETFYISNNVHKIGDNKYRATATMFQKFCGYRKHNDSLKKHYCDVTKRTIAIYIEVISGFGEKHFPMVKLGNVSVMETTPTE